MTYDVMLARKVEMTPAPAWADTARATPILDSPVVIAFLIGALLALLFA